MGKTSRIFGVRKTCPRAKSARKRLKNRAKTVEFCGSIVQQLVDTAMEEGDGQNYNFPPFIDEDLYNEIANHELCIEVEKCAHIEGSRIVKSMNYFVDKLITAQFDHNKTCKGKLRFEKEIMSGLASTFELRCGTCHCGYLVVTEDPSKKPTVNKDLVWATLATGGCYAHTSEMLSVLDIPGISKSLFYATQRELGKVYKDSLWEEMQLAGKEEHDLAVRCGDVDEDGIPFITVCLDGGWSKRSYGHSFDALSGVAVIIGRKTGKVLFVGIKNKYCSVCAKSESRGSPCDNHVCFKNYSGASGSMEQSIIVEGFKQSVEMHKLRFKTFIGDGDSTVYTKIKQNVPYTVQKIECVNHVMKNYGKHLFKIKNNTKTVALAVRKLLTGQKILQLQRNAQKLIYVNHACGDNNLMRLKEDLRNSVKCVFGHHAKCREEVCKTPGDVSNSQYESLQLSGAYHHIYSALNSVVVKAPQLVMNETNNKSEAFMNVLARFNMGKRLNLVQRDSFQIRAHLTALRYNRGSSWHAAAYKNCYKKSPGKILKKYMARLTESERKERLRVKPRCMKKLKFEAKQPAEVDYGSNIAEINLSPEDLEVEKRKFLEQLHVTLAKRNEIAEMTIGQFDNPIYIDARLNRLTASHFGAVIRRRPTTPCHSLVATILTPNSSFHSPATQYGKINETVAISKFEQQTGKVVKKAGLYIHVEYGFLGASPDGIINEEEIVEVKCLFKVASLGISLEDAVFQKKVDCLEMRDDAIGLKTGHNYFLQVQGQLAITGASVCYFIIYSGDQNDLYIEEVQFDKKLWETLMLPKLKAFYLDCLAPNIIEDRPKKGRCKDPSYVVEAIQEKKRKKEELEKKNKKKKSE